MRQRAIAATLRMRGFAPEQALLLSCDPRSGSTWLSELLVAAAPSAVIWEPFHLDSAPRVREAGFAWRQVIPAEADWPEAEALVRDILSGRCINDWTSWASSFGEFLAAERLVVKCCRANGFLPWMLRRIAFRRRPIHFLRHPFAIAASQIRMGNFGTDGMAADLERGPFAADFVESAAYIRGLETDEERIVAMWCRVQGPALRDPVTAEKAVRLHYETMTLDPAAEIGRLFAAWGEPVPEPVLSRVRRASRMTEDASLLDAPEAQVGKWQTHFTDRQVARMGRVLRDFDIAAYDETPLPRRLENSPAAPAAASPA
ncbi:hypothetical protein [Limimaricola pyoseonensis]|uniref:hypothetical protein n=1 Tax=Limimaricola pyoseonensis TaxID=521013 RepID=UPI000B7D0236|nr:hypothetical protein [Limimaricola pyoseonensis]